MDENILYDSVTKDITTKSGQYDIVSIGPYQTSIWAKSGWLTDLTPRATKDAAYDVNDLIPTVRKSLSDGDKLLAVPFYGESSFTMYRKDLFDKAGVTMPAKPTWTQIIDLAKELDDKENGVSGICLRGKPGWGENMALMSTWAHTNGGEFYDADFKPHLSDPAYVEAATQYVNLVRNYGEPGAAGASFPECLTLYTQGKTAMWVDATVAASLIEDESQSKVVGKSAYVPSPVLKTADSGWLWAWALGIPETSKNKEAAWTFAAWATSKDYHKLVGEKLGWSRVPPGARTSTYAVPEYKKAASSYAAPTLAAIESGWTNFVAIPEYQGLGTRVSQELTAAIAGKQTVADAMAKGQQYAEQTAKDGGYGK